MPNVSNVRKLISALRSGNYMQGAGLLMGDDHYCVFGVATDLWHQETGRGEWSHEPGNNCFVLDGKEHEQRAPQEVMDWLGFGDHEHNELIDQNDSHMSFEEIADDLERLMVRYT